MWLTLTLAGINLVLSAFNTYLLKLPGVDLTPFALVLIAMSGENVVVGAILLTLAYMIVKPSRFGFVWLQIPVAVLVGYLTLWTGNLYLGPLAYYAISVSAGLLMGIFNGRYILSTLIGLSINFSLLRIYGFLH